MDKVKKIIPGLIIVTLISILAISISSKLILGPVVIAILLGIIIGNIFNFDKKYINGISFSESTLLNLSIILMGFNLDVIVIKKINYDILFLLLILIISSLLITFVLGKIFKISSNLSILLGIGNAICGSSAIAGASKLLKSKEEEIALSISVVNIIGAIGIFFVPYIINVLTINNIFHQGVIIGSTIQAVGQVVAAGHVFGAEVGETATLIKMVRILSLGPVLFCLSLFMKSKENNILKNIPYFIVGFVFVIFLNNSISIPNNIVNLLKYVSKIFLILSMTAIGLKVSLNSIFNYGSKVFIIGMLSFIIQIFIAIQFVT